MGRTSRWRSVAKRVNPVVNDSRRNAARADALSLQFLLRLLHLFEADPFFRPVPLDGPRPLYPAGGLMQVYRARTRESRPCGSPPTATMTSSMKPIPCNTSPVRPPARRHPRGSSQVFGMWQLGPQLRPHLLRRLRARIPPGLSCKSCWFAPLAIRRKSRPQAFCQDVSSNYWLVML